VSGYVGSGVRLMIGGPHGPTHGRNAGRAGPLVGFVTIVGAGVVEKRRGGDTGWRIGLSLT
jgi:hypothetical protein